MLEKDLAYVLPILDKLPQLVVLPSVICVDEELAQAANKHPTLQLVRLRQSPTISPWVSAILRIRYGSFSSQKCDIL
jgi:hypothetical protein